MPETRRKDPLSTWQLDKMPIIACTDRHRELEQLKAVQELLLIRCVLKLESTMDQQKWKLWCPNANPNDSKFNNCIRTSIVMSRPVGIPMDKIDDPYKTQKNNNR